jgi:hypothetical protein
MSKIKEFLDGLGNNAPFLAFGAFMGALLYARHRKLKVWEALTAIILGVGASVAIGPFIVHWLGMKDLPSTYAALGFLIGMLVKEASEIVFKVADQLEQDPGFITDWIRKRRGKK